MQAHRPQQDVTSELQLAMAALRAELQRRVSAATPSTPRQARALTHMLTVQHQPSEPGNNVSTIHSTLDRYTSVLAVEIAMQIS